MRVRKDKMNRYLYFAGNYCPCCDAVMEFTDAAQGEGTVGSCDRCGLRTRDVRVYHGEYRGPGPLLKLLRMWRKRA
jgi:hypothetical protein